MLSAQKTLFVWSVAGTIKLFVTDGTVAGTSSLGPAPSADSLTVAGANVFYTTYDDVAGVKQLWRSDGTTFGTRMVTAFPAGDTIGNLVGSGSLFFLFAKKPV